MSEKVGAINLIRMPQVVTRQIVTRHRKNMDLSYVTEELHKSPCQAISFDTVSDGGVQHLHGGDTELDVSNTQLDGCETELDECDTEFNGGDAELDYDVPVSQIPYHLPPSQVDISELLYEFKSFKVEMGEALSDLTNEIKAMNSQMDSKLSSALNKVEEANKTVQALQKENKILKNDITTLKERVQSLEMYNMKDNLIIEGINQHADENCVQKVKNFFRDHLKLPQEQNVTLQKCHRFRGQGKNGKPAPMICRFLYANERQKVWSLRKNLKGTSFVLREHFPAEIHRNRSILFPIMKAAVAQKKKSFLQGDKLVIGEKSYTVDTLNQLPDDLDPAKLAQRQSDKVTAFFTGASPLSNFYPKPNLVIDGSHYAHVEQYLQSQKAYYAEKPQIAAEIKRTNTPAACKRMGDALAVNENDWLPLARNAVYKACSIKFRLDPRAREFLLQTGNRILAEAGPNLIWGTGAKLNHPDVLDTIKWKGNNELGNILCKIRSELSLAQNVKK